MSKHIKSSDAQALWQALIDAYKEGAGYNNLKINLKKRWQDFKCDDHWTKPLVAFLENWTMRLHSYEEATGLIVDDDHHQMVLKEAILI